MGIGKGPWIPLCWLVLAACVGPAHASANPRPATEESAVHPSAEEPTPLLRGRLDNGLTYAILPRRSNEPGVGLLMRNEGGFIAERRPGERGLAI